MSPQRRLLAAIAAVAPVGIVLAAARPAGMAAQMLVHAPLLFGAGLCAGSLGARPGWRRVDASGLAGATLASAVMAAWMVPALLDAAAISAPGTALRLASWWGAGVALAQSWPRLPPALRLLMAIGQAGMFAGVGLVFGETDLRLCASFLLGDQQVASRGLVAFGLLLGLAAGAGAAAQRPEAGAPAAAGSEITA